MLCQVFFRYIFTFPLGWTEEAARILLVTSVYAALPAAYVRGEHIIVDIFVNKFPTQLRHGYIYGLKAIVFLVCLYLAIGAVLQMTASASMTFVSMPWLPVSILYVVQCAALLSMGVSVILTWADPHAYTPDPAQVQGDN